MDTQHDRSKAPGLPDVEQTLLLLRLGKLTDDEIVTALRQFGALRLLDARASVEQLLESRNPRVRVAALETLLLSWKLSEHVESARRFLLDPDTGCRMFAMRYFQETRGHSVDFDTLSPLARIATTSQETDELRLEAYCTILAILNVPLTLRHLRDIAGFAASGRRFEDLSWIDWNLLTLLYESQQEQPRRYCTLLGSVDLRYDMGQAAALTRDGSLLACTSSNPDGSSFAVEVWNLRGAQYRLLWTGERIALQNDDQGTWHEGRAAPAATQPGPMEGLEEAVDWSDEEEIVERDLVAWSPDGTHLAVAGRDGILDVWQVNWEEGQECRRLLSHRTARGYLALSWGNRRLCLAAATASELLFWEEPGHPVQQLAYSSEDDEYRLPERVPITALTFTPDDASLFTGNASGQLVQWDVSYGRPRDLWSWATGGRMPVECLACSPDGTRMAVHNVTGNEIDGVIGEATSILYRRAGHVFRFGNGGVIEHILGWSPDGSLLLGVRLNDVQTGVFVELLDAFTGDLLASYEVSARTFPELQPHDYFRTFDARLSPDGKQFFWCATVQRRFYAPGPAGSSPTWYGIITLPPMQREVAGGLPAHSFTEFAGDAGPWWQAVGDERLTERMLIPTVRMLRSLLARGDTVTLSLNIRSDSPAQ